MYLSPLVRHAVTHPRAWLLLYGAVTLGLGGGIGRLELRTDGASLHPQQDQFVVDTEHDRLRFHDPRQLILLASSTETGPAVASPAGFRFLDQIHSELRALPAVRATGIFSLVSLPKPDKSASGFALGTFLQDIPDDGAAFASLLAEIRAERLTDGLLLSSDGRHAAFYVPLAETRRVPDLIDEVTAWIDSRPQAPFTLELTGPEVAEATLGRMVLRDLAVLVPAMVALIIAMLLYVFRNPGGVIVPMAESLAVLVWTLGAMGWLGVPVTLVTTILPVLLMAMSITDEIYLLERVQDHVAATPLAPIAGSVEASLAEIGRAVIATTVTTVLGFLAFTTSSIPPLRQFGMFAAFGLLAAMLLSFSAIPALIVSLPQSWFRPRQRTSAGRAPTLATWAVQRPALAFALALAVVAASVPGIWRLVVQDSWVDNFADDDPMVAANRAVNASFWGSYRFDVVVEADTDTFYTPIGAELMDRLAAVAAAAPHVGGVLSYVDLLQDVADALAQRRRLSSMSALEVADVAAVAEMSENRLQLRQLLTDTGTAARMRLFVSDADYARTVSVKKYLDLHLPRVAAQYGVSYHFSGDLPVALATVDAIVGNQVRSIGWALATVAATLLLVFAHGRAAAVVMVPVGATVVVLLGAMGYAGMPLGIATSMFAALTVGVGVDFGIHALDRYVGARRDGLDHRRALAAMVEKSGRAIAWNAQVLAVGFLVLGLSSLKPNHSLGLLLASAMVACYAGTTMLLPWLLRTIASIVLALAVLASPAVSAETAEPCDAMPDPAARAIIESMEKAFRSEPRITRMYILTRYGESHPLHEYSEKTDIDKILWGVFNGDIEQTRMLYTFTGPGRLAGTSLLMHDAADAAAADEMWLYLRSFDKFTKLEPSSQQVMVPGTALTYEDSRGFIPLDKYEFSFAAPQPASKPGEDTVILACPKNATIANNLGYASLRIGVDKEKNLVRRVDYSGLGGKPLKTYELVEAVEHDKGWQPAKVRMTHLADGYTTTIAYEHWRPKTPIPPDLYRPETTAERFLPRLERVLAGEGLGERVKAEIATANARISAYEQRVREHKAKQADEQSERTPAPAD